ncbi:MAG: two-component system sensor histidine kinase KdbD [Chromatiales bacterium 21-64-14]|nr:MAG: two-component system sensor histidine kinase KdbD [Chromatiales bacterium 21-64-14]HQU16058.1 two-component system sensor histidine kinase KdpD [Gammaproteobacteria bacterium]
MTDTDQRPSPDALLAQVQREDAKVRRGKLKIFFGACAGVGKTYSMLSAARQLLAQGHDVVVGVVETHSRSETAALLEGLEVLRLREVAYRGNTLLDFDLDAALQRHPEVLLVDELAHSNAPGSRRLKRWQDVAELLDAGIDVYSTLNVQHLESLNDVVGSVTGIRVRETVPDRVFDHAEEILLVDLPPDDLIARLKRGQVYLAAQASYAIENFFRKGNLIALRELALRRTAERVDEQMQGVRRTVLQSPVWQTGDSVLACIGPEDLDGRVVRVAARLAARRQAEWHCVYVETARLERLPAARREAVLATLKLAEQLGAETTVLAAQDAPATVIDYARQHNLGRIVLGRGPNSGRWSWQSFMRRLEQLASDIDILTVARKPAFNPPQRQDVAPGHATHSPLLHYAYAVVMCAAVTLLATPLLLFFDRANIVMLFLLGVVVIAYRFGRGPSVLAAMLSVLSFDFFFVPPRFNFSVSDVQYLLTFAVMLIVGLVIGHLTAGLRYEARMARYRESRARNLYEFARALSSALTVEQVMDISRRSLQSSSQASTHIILPDDDGKLHAGTESSDDLDRGVAQWCFDHGEPAGAGTSSLPGHPHQYLPLVAPMRVRGVLVVNQNAPSRGFLPEQQRRLEAFAALIGIALERIHFVTVARDTLIKMESDRLRNSLLAALSHDLRTPLTALMGLAETLSFSIANGTTGQRAQVEAIGRQARSTFRIVDNLLQMASLESGEVKLRRDWQSIEEIVSSALREVDSILCNHPVTVHLPADLPLVRCDALPIERVLVNLLENATKYTPDGTHVGITARINDKMLEVEVWDVGPGISPGHEEAIFERFARGDRETAIPGVGLGLAISRAIVEAHGGRIRADNRPEGGARFRFTLPLEPLPAAVEEGE